MKTGVLFVSSADHPGADTFVHTSIMRELDRSRFDVHVAFPAGPPDSRTPVFQVLSRIPDLHLRPTSFGPSLSGRSRSDKAVQMSLALPAVLTGFAGLAGYIRRHGISIVHSTDRPRDAVSCVVLAKLAGVKSVIHVHVKCADWMSRSVRWAMARADALVGVSRFVARSLVDNGYPAQKTHAVLNAIDPASWDFRLSPDPVRRELGISSTAPVVACAARLFRGKGQDDLIRAISRVTAEFPDVRVLMIGRDDLNAMSTSFTEELKILAASLNVSQHVIFTGHRADMPALFAASDVFALPSFEEPFGLVYVESMAMKKPVVAYNSGGAPEVVEHGKTGLLCPPTDNAALAGNLMTLLRDPALRARMGEAGRHDVEARFTLARMARDMESVYATLR